MTPVHSFESLTKSNYVIAQKHLCHWPVVNDTNALSLIYTQQCAFVSLTNVHSCHWPLCIGVIDHPIRSSKKALVSAFVSLTNVHSCHWPMCIRVIDHQVWFTPRSVHWCHWPLPKEGWLSLSRHAPSCIGVIDHWSMTRMHWVWFKPSRLHSCHWPMFICVIDQCAFVSLTTECDLHPVVCIRVIDHY